MTFIIKIDLYMFQLIFIYNIIIIIILINNKYINCNVN